MNKLSRIIDWFTAWYTPVSGELIDALEKASKEAAAASADHARFPYQLFVTRKSVLISNRNDSLLKSLSNYILYIWQGRPLPLLLYQKDATGQIGPFGKIRKSKRAKGKIKENALLFSPAPEGRIDPVKTRQVMKVGVGDANLAREIRMLRMVGAGTGFTPQVIGYDPKLKWHAIKFIGNAERLDEPEQANIYLKHIAEKYFTFWGVKSRKVMDHLRRLEISEKVFIETAEALGFKEAQHLLAGELNLSITHGGGICEECLLTDDGEAYFLDWEKARLAPIGDDLLQVFPYQPNDTIKIFNKFVGANNLLSSDQLKVSLICRHFANTARRSPIREKVQLDQRSAELLR